MRPKSYKELASTLEAPTCPRCGGRAIETETRYGILSKCCGLWSWDRCPLVDKATHDVRRYVGKLLSEMAKSVEIGWMHNEIIRRSKVNYPKCMQPREMNEAECKKVAKALDDMMMDIACGEAPARRARRL